jgi:hypothetical protein
VALGLLYLAFRNVDFEAFLAKTKEVDYTWIYISIVLSLVPYFLRAYRWNLLLEGVGYRKLSTPRTSVSVIIGYLANLALPRMGEMTRCAVLQKTDGVKFSEGLGTVITERLLDAITLLGIIGLTFIVEYDRLADFFRENIFSKFQLSSSWLFVLVLIAVIAVIAVIGAIVFVIVARKILRSSSTNKVVNFAREIIKGLDSLRKIKSPLGFILSSIGIWVSYYFMSYIIVFTLPETSHLDWMAGMALLVTGGIGMAAPVQGGIGTFHLFVSAMLISYGVDQQSGIFLATLLHTSQVGAIILFGAISSLLSVFMEKRTQTDGDTQ